MNRLPTELWLYTLEKYLLHASSLHASVPDLTPDLKTLQACTLTCRSLRLAAQPLLFWKTTITVTDWDSEHNALQRVDFLLTLFHDFPGSSGWVRHLRIRDYSAESEHISGRGFHTMVSTLLPQMNLVQHLELYAIQLSTSAVTHILTLASVKTLDLTASSWDNILEPELRAELPSLVALTIKCYEENPTLPDVIFEQPRLQSLDLSGTVAVRLLCQSVENMLSRQASPILSNITSLAIGITGDTAFYQYLSHSDVLPHLVSVQGEAEFLSALLAGSRPIINVAIGSSDLRAVGIEDVRIALANCRQVLSLELYKMKRSLSFWPTLANLCPNLTVILIHYIIGDIMVRVDHCLRQPLSN